MFDRQVHTLVDRGYPALSGLSEAAFRARLEPLRSAATPTSVLVIGALAPWPETVARVSLGTRTGFHVMDPDDHRRFAPIPTALPPSPDAWLLHDVDTGTAHLNVTPDDALAAIHAAGRSPLTIEEGIALVTHFPETLRKNACFSLAGSRRGDRRVPALWISDGRPKLGWCWAGNPHTWLGSASCAARSGLALPAERVAGTRTSGTEAAPPS